MRVGVVLVVLVSVVMCVTKQTYKEIGILHKINPREASPAHCHCHPVLAS